MRYLAIDWSGAKKRAAEKIWLAEVTHGRLVRLESGRDRDAVTLHLIEEANRDPNLMVGLDFAFSFPRWFVQKAGVTEPLALWDLVARDGERWLTDCEPPLWGRPGRARPDAPEHFRRTELEVGEGKAIRPKSVFQIGGAGAVGTGSIRGMPVLAALARAGFAIWPFDTPRLPTVIEIYPRLLTRAVVKSNHAARTEYLREGFPEMGDSLRELAATSEDALDAAVSAVIMARQGAGLLELPAARDEVEAIEGRIWVPDESGRSPGRLPDPPRTVSSERPTVLPPSSDDQLAFLRQLQRVLDEGSFTATYKYALVHAIADLCVTRGDDSGAPLELPTREIAERFVELYWRQVVPFPAGELSEVLSQITGGRAAIVARIAESRTSYGGSILRLKQSGAAWEGLVRAVERDVLRYPLLLLQTVGFERVEFLYDNVLPRRSVTLKPGVAYCFRAFYPMITDIVRGAWANFVQRQNAPLLGSATDLHGFLFGSERAALDRYRPILEEVQRSECLYCRRPLRGSASGDAAVDHFIPWRRYPTDLAHNFVLAHARCNGQKADRLAAEPHLERWLGRNELHLDVLSRAFDGAGLLHDHAASIRVARWAYGQVEQMGGQVWLEGSRLAPLGAAWREVLRAG